MLQKLEIRAFFFNAKTDYLPYYKNFNLAVGTDATVKDLLAQIQEANENFSYPDQKLLMKVNDLVVEGKQSIVSLVERLGTAWQIDPVSSYRSNNGLKINDDDFMQRYALLEPYATQEDFKFYETLYALHYASETESFDRDYIGDAILVLAHKMITEGSEHKEAILETITSAYSGLLDCEYENNLFNAQYHAASIDELKAMVKQESKPSLCAKLMARFSKKEKKSMPIKRAIETIDNLEEKQVAHYFAQASHFAMHKLVSEKGIKGIHFPRANKLCGLGVLQDNKVLAFKKAGSILLDAFDRGAEVLIVEDVAALDMFKKHFSDIEKTIGRKMIGLELILAEDFVSQVGAIEA